MDSAFDSQSIARPFSPASPQQIQEQLAFFRSDALLHTILNGIPDIVLVLNPQRQIVFANHALLETLNISEADLMRGLRLGEVLDCAHANEQRGCGTTEFCNNCGAARALITSLGGEKMIQECRIIRLDGSALDLLVSGTPLALKEGTFSIFTIKDHSHEKRRRVLERIFFHDVLNAAGVVSGYLDLLNSLPESEHEGLLGRATHSAGCLVEEIQAQRDLIAAENDDLMVGHNPLEVGHFLEEIVAGYRSHTAAQDRAIHFVPEPQPITLISDAALLRRVIANILKNALEATPVGGTITLRYGMETGGVMIEVHNPACMPRHVELQVFQRSFSTKGKGRGLGTYSMRLLTERYLKGKISFTTSPEAGTCFRVWYPADISCSD